MSFEFTPVNGTVEFPGGHLTVRGLDLPAITRLAAAHASALSLLFNQAAQDPENALSASALLGEKLLTEFPSLAADAIALAADVPEQAAQIAQIPFPAQIEALEKIGQLTFRTEQDLKKVLEIVVRAAKGVTATLQSSLT